MADPENLAQTGQSLAPVDHSAQPSGPISESTDSQSRFRLDHGQLMAPNNLRLHPQHPKSALAVRLDSNPTDLNHPTDPNHQYCDHKDLDPCSSGYCRLQLMRPRLRDDQQSDEPPTCGAR